MADERTRRQKLQAMADDPGASEGERTNARSILERMGPEPEPLRWRPKGEGYSPPRGAEGQRAGQKSSRATFEELKRQMWGDFANYRDAWWQEELRRAQAQETLRRAGFTMPGDRGFEASFAAEAARAQQTFRRASEDVSRAQRRDPLDVGDTERLMRDYLEGRASIDDLRRHMGMEDL